MHDWNVKTQQGQANPRTIIQKKLLIKFRPRILSACIGVHSVPQGTPDSLGGISLPGSTSRQHSSPIAFRDTIGALTYSDHSTRGTSPPGATSPQHYDSSIPQNATTAGQNPQEQNPI